MEYDKDDTIEEMLNSSGEGCYDDYIIAQIRNHAIKYDRDAEERTKMNNINCQRYYSQSQNDKKGTGYRQPGSP